MPKLRRLHVAGTGARPSRAGVMTELTKDDIEELASSYAPHLHQCKLAVDDVQTAISLGAPAVLGHLDPRLVEAKGAMPAFGTVLSAQAAQGDLFLDLELTDSLAGWIDQGMYDHVSVSWYDRNDPRNPTPGKLHLRHVGWLGAEPSAMKDLQLPDASSIEYAESVYQGHKLNTAVFDIEFAEAPDMVSKTAQAEDKQAKGVMKPEVPAKVDNSTEMADAPADETVTAEAEPVAADELPVDEAPEGEAVDPVLMLTSILQDGDKGYKGEISEYRPEPTVDNSFLWNEDEGEFKGQFVDLSGNEEEVYDFTLKLQEDGSMVRSYRKVQAEDIDATDAEVEAEADAADEPVEMGEGCGDKRKEMSECDELTAGFGQIWADTDTQVSMPESEYKDLLAKASMADSLLAEKAAVAKAQRMAQIEQAIAPLFDLGLLGDNVQPGNVANAIMAMADSERYEYEFSEGVVHTEPVETVLAVLSQIATKAKIAADTEIEFGEMAIAPAKPTAPAKAAPVGTMNDPKQAEIDAKARQICKDNGWDCGNSRDYMKAVKMAMKS